MPPLSGLLLEWCYTGRPPRKTRFSFSSLYLSGPRKSQARAGSPELLMQAHGSQQVSLLTPRPIPGPAGSVRAFAGVAQLVEHLFCKQVVSGSIPLASSSHELATSSQTAEFVSASEGCPSGQREQAVNLPARAYVGSNPTPSTNKNHARTARELGRGMTGPRRRFDDTLDSAGVTQLVESQFSKLKVDGSSPFSRSIFFFSFLAPVFSCEPSPNGEHIVSTTSTGCGNQAKACPSRKLGRGRSFGEHRSGAYSCT